MRYGCACIVALIVLAAPTEGLANGFILPIFRWKDGAGRRSAAPAPSNDGLGLIRHSEGVSRWELEQREADRHPQPGAVTLLDAVNVVSQTVAFLAQLKTSEHPRDDLRRYVE